MPTTMNLEEVNSQLLGLVEFVESKNSAITVMRSGQPIVRIVPIKARRNIEPDDLLMGASIRDEDLFDDCTNQFEAMAHA